MVSRISEIELGSLLGAFPAVALLGPRQVGKTTLARTCLKKGALYLDLELPSDLRKLADAEFFLGAHADRLVIIDEVQRKADLFPVLRALIDQNRKPGRFLLLGSARPEMLRESSETLAGRIAYLEISPFSLAEIGAQSWRRLWLRGGFPLAYLARSDEQAFRWLMNFVSTYVERDLPLLGAPAPPQVMRRLLQMVASQQSGLLNKSDFARSLGLSQPTITTYLNFLEGAFLIRILRPYHVNLGKRLVKAPKIYIRDSGVLHSLVEASDMNGLMGLPIAGGSFEGFALEQLIARFSDRDAYFYRTHGGTECDLIIAPAGKPKFAFDFKLSQSPAVMPSMLETMKDLKIAKGYYIIPGNEFFEIKKNIFALGIEQITKFRF